MRRGLSWLGAEPEGTLKKVKSDAIPALNGR